MGKGKNKLSLILVIILLLYLVFLVGALYSSYRKGGINSPYLQYDESQVVNIERFFTPTENEIIDALKKVDGITRVMAVTEYHDPNKGLSKKDGYYSAIYIEYDKVDNSNLEGSDLVDKGTDAGGAIEIYRNEKDLEKRYKKFKTGRVVGAGGCYRIGTMLIRTSSLLTLEEQEELLGKIIKAIDSN